MIRSFLVSVSLIALGATAGVPVAAQSVSGAYLAGRQAAMSCDFAEAAKYYSQALAHDPRNPEFLEGTMLAYLSSGDVAKAIPLAKFLEVNNQRSQVAYLVRTAGLAQAENYQGLIAQVGDEAGIGLWVDALIKAWAYVGLGDMATAIIQFDELSNVAGIKVLVMYHKALALASVGDFEGAETILSSGIAGSAAQTRRGVGIRAEILAQLGRKEQAIELLTASFGDNIDPEMQTLITALQSDQPISYAGIIDAKTGIAEVFFNFAVALREESAGDGDVLHYARIVRFLRTEHNEALLLTADLLNSLGQYDLAIQELQDVPTDNRSYPAARLIQAAALRQDDRSEQAIEVLQQLIGSHAHLPSVHFALADVLRTQGDNDGAIKSYDLAIGLTPYTDPQRWVLFYARGVAAERIGDAESAEKDFRAALAINPDQPEVLNHFGYSLVEQGRNLDEALNMIERAVALRPTSGYIVDSLGWVLYRLGRYEEAVWQIERASEMNPVDPVVNDHLGDAYWAVGREREAEFQWSRALSFADAEDVNSVNDQYRMRRKLEVGLDVVLAEEGGNPLKRVMAER
ncbi:MULTISPECIES: tetratricopeptide repeat protein [unclassified Yoonia]|uniref:tetratricopeptide repeat protein n=1 Tax=unclassified Yoonia TaxID=2629118 RepID=UPI002AFFB34B|nr:MULTISPECIES: tetratricopeptide repeat protein [unclassified Yoonia]